jgi:quinol monooxygenase YgiN
MTGPFVFIGTHRIAAGQLEAFKKDARALVQLVREREPQLLSFNFFFNEDETEVSVVQVHPDAASMLTHMQVAREHITEATEASSPRTFRSTGRPMEPSLE